MNAPLQATPAPATPPQTVIYAVGDIHGRLDLLRRFTQELDTDARAAALKGVETVVVFLGDYIDRGPESAGVIAHLIALRDEGPCTCIFLRGNHEDIVLKLASGEEHSARWLEFGGLETLASYGVDYPKPTGPGDGEALQAAVRDVIPRTHLQFMRDTELYAKLGDYIFVHAGLRPDRLLEEQSDGDLLWYRYYDEEAPVWTETVVHGHSVNPRPVRGRSRIGIDTGAYDSGVLTVLRLEDSQEDLLKIVAAGDGQPVGIGRWDSVDSAFSQREPGRAASPAAAPIVRPQAANSDAPRARVVPPRSSARLAMGVGVAAAAVLLLGGAAVWASRTPDAPATRAAPILRPVEPAFVEPAMAQATPVEPEEVADAPVAEAPLAPATEAPPVAPAVPAAPVTSGLRAQIGALPSAEAAQLVWSDVARRFPAEMGAKAMETEPVENGRLVRAFVTGFASPGEAASFCATLTAGGQPCLVRRR
ncbi:MAG: metallophosphoesterase [Phenylobacterium sp.]|uniref:metallophosphoesterase n=1 Tax=Phenylobacterium sp. TaxID=1871053 RepID=UPI0027339E52|nr:metallophosphoesterase [Phenylobacterium sp.]MDP3173565.1 metallophosphoesterase [Phenylobacterium sp.]